MFMHLRYIFFFNDTATTEIYTLSLHDALPIFDRVVKLEMVADVPLGSFLSGGVDSSSIVAMMKRHSNGRRIRSEEHTSELQSQSNLVCRLLLEKKKT